MCLNLAWTTFITFGVCKCKTLLYLAAHQYLKSYHPFDKARRYFDAILLLF